MREREREREREKRDAVSHIRKGPISIGNGALTEAEKWKCDATRHVNGAILEER